jgi:hypothetical protein
MVSLHSCAAYYRRSSGRREDERCSTIYVEYERVDGRREVDNAEVTTVHYRGTHASGEVAAGFTRFRGSTGRVGSASADGGSPPFDPHTAEELLL